MEYTTCIAVNVQKQGQNLVHVFNSKSGCMHSVNLLSYEAKLPNLKLKTQSKQLWGSLHLNIAFLSIGNKCFVMFYSAILNYHSWCKKRRKKEATYYLPTLKDFFGEKGSPLFIPIYFKIFVKI
jgi:hypothetical protein